MQKASGDVRVSFLPNVDGDKDTLLNMIVLAALQELSSEKAVAYVLSLLKDKEAIANGKLEIIVRAIIKEKSINSSYYLF